MIIWLIWTEILLHPELGDALHVIITIQEQSR